MTRFRLRANTKVMFHMAGCSMDFYSGNWEPKLTLCDVTYDENDCVSICKDFYTNEPNRGFATFIPESKDVALREWIKAFKADAKLVNDTALCFALPAKCHTQFGVDHILIPAAVVEVL